MSEKDVESICPQPEDLTVGGVVVCTAEGCGHEFQSSSHLHMHKARHHSGKPMEKASGGKIQQFYCPVEECKRSVGKGRPFPRMGQLKQVGIESATRACTICGSLYYSFVVLVKKFEVLYHGNRTVSSQ